MRSGGVDSVGGGREGEEAYTSQAAGIIIIIIGIATIHRGGKKRGIRMRGIKPQKRGTAVTLCTTNGLYVKANKPRRLPSKQSTYSHTLCSPPPAATLTKSVIEFKSPNSGP